MAEPIKVAILGGSGFMGYDLAKTLHAGPEYEPIVLSTSAKNLANVSRHRIAVELLSYEALRHTVLAEDVRFLVNYAHPFGNRDALSIDQQLDVIADFLVNNLERNPALRVVHVSSMSVYEPFVGIEACDETAVLRAPRGDRYARAKCRLESRLDSHCELRDRVLILRPTVVYGPFCRPWTDALLAGFESGDLAYRDLHGRVQPVFVGDVSRFVIDRFADFASGAFNLAGPESLPWHEFFGFFEGVVGRGKLVRRARTAPSPSRRTGEVARFVGDWVGAGLRQPRVKDRLRPLAARLPARFVEGVKHRFNDNLGELGRTARLEPAICEVYCDPFYAKDRLVSMHKTRGRFPDTVLTPLSATRDLISRYHGFRFRDEVLT